MRGAGQGSATRAIGASFGVSALASVGLIVVYVAGGQPQIEGALIAVSLGGLGLGLIVWAHRMMPGGHFVQERAEHATAGAAPGAPAEDDGVGRRTFLARMLAVAAGALGVAALFPFRSLGEAPGRALFHTDWTPGARVVTQDGTPVTLDALEVGGVLTVFPEGHLDSADSQTLLIRADPATLSPVEGREDWAPQGYVAYSKVCTHAGCPVGLYEPESRLLYCPCHQSTFDVADGARPTSGPASTPLPQLPLEFDGDSTLVARGDFSAPVGPSFWDSP